MGGIQGVNGRSHSGANGGSLPWQLKLGVEAVLDSAVFLFQVKQTFVNGAVAFSLGTSQHQMLQMLGNSSACGHLSGSLGPRLLLLMPALLAFIYSDASRWGFPLCLLFLQWLTFQR